MKNLGTLLSCLSIASGIVALPSFAGDDPVNCRNEVVSQTPIYSGTASCEAPYSYAEHSKAHPNSSICTDITRIDATETLSQFVPERTSSTIELQGLVEISRRGAACAVVTERFSVDCLASVPFSHNEDVVEYVCDYTPQARISVTQRPNHPTGFNHVSFSSTSTDRDGHISAYKWYINGSLVGTGGGYFMTTELGEHVNVRLEVTDNDGYTDSTSTSVYLQPWTCNGCNPF